MNINWIGFSFTTSAVGNTGAAGHKWLQAQNLVATRGFIKLPRKWLPGFIFYILGGYQYIFLEKFDKNIYESSHI